MASLCVNPKTPYTKFGGSTCIHIHVYMHVSKTSLTCNTGHAGYVLRGGKLQWPQCSAQWPPCSGPFGKQRCQGPSWCLPCCKGREREGERGQEEGERNEGGRERGREGGRRGGEGGRGREGERGQERGRERGRERTGERNEGGRERGRERTGERNEGGREMGII